MALPSISRLAPRLPRLAPLTKPSSTLFFPTTRTTTLLRRPYTSDADTSMTPTESEIASSLSSDETLKPTYSVLVRDVSGGCGSMYAIDIASERFKGKGLLQQQRLVTKALGERVKEWHGVQIRTSVPPTE